MPKLSQGGFRRAIICFQSVPVYLDIPAVPRGERPVRAMLTVVVGRARLVSPLRYSLDLLWALRGREPKSFFDVQHHSRLYLAQILSPERNGGSYPWTKGQNGFKLSRWGPLPFINSLDDLGTNKIGEYSAGKCRGSDFYCW